MSQPQSQSHEADLPRGTESAGCGEGNCGCAAPAPAAHEHRRGVEFPGVIDAITHDPATDVVTLLMVEPRPWTGSERQMFQLQEKFNAYLSFALDGEMDDAYPQLSGKKLQLRLDCATAPDAMAAHFLKMVRDQIAFQGITLEVRAASPAPASGGCGEGCGCAG